MSDLTLGSVIGKLSGGGVEVHTIPVNFVAPSGTGIQHVVNVPIPSEVTARVMVVGISGATTAGYGLPYLRIGGVTVAYPVQAFAGEMVVTGPTVVEVNRRGAPDSYDPSFVGTVYWWEEAVGNE